MALLPTHDILNDNHKNRGRSMFDGKSILITGS